MQKIRHQGRLELMLRSLSPRPLQGSPDIKHTSSQLWAISIKPTSMPSVPRKHFREWVDYFSFEVTVSGNHVTRAAPHRDLGLPSGLI